MPLKAVVSCLSSRVVLASACSWWAAQPRPAQHKVLHGFR